MATCFYRILDRFSREPALFVILTYMYWIFSHIPRRHPNKTFTATYKFRLKENYKRFYGFESTGDRARFLSVHYLRPVRRCLPLGSTPWSGRSGKIFVHYGGTGIPRFASAERRSRWAAGCFMSVEVKRLEAAHHRWQRNMWDVGWVTNDEVRTSTGQQGHRTDSETEDGTGLVTWYRWTTNT